MLIDTMHGSPDEVSPVDASHCAALAPPRKTARGRTARPPADGEATEAPADSGLSAPRQGADSGAIAAETVRRTVGIRAHMDALAATQWSRMSDDDLLDAIRNLEEVARSLYGLQARAAAAAEDRGVAERHAARSTAHLLHQALNITVGEARSRLAVAAITLPQQGISGAVVAPPVPRLLTAIGEGTVSAGHGRVIAHCLSKMPSGVDADTAGMCMDLLLTEASTRDENGLRHVAEKILAIVDPDGSLSEPPEDRAELHIGARRGDGLTPIRGLLAPLTAEQLRVAIESLSEPRPVDAGIPDPRPAALRREQALGEVLHRFLTAGAGPRDGGIRPQVVVTVRREDLFPSCTPTPATSSHDRASADSSGAPATGSEPVTGSRPATGSGPVAGSGATSGLGSSTASSTASGPGSSTASSTTSGPASETEAGVAWEPTSGEGSGIAWSDYGGVQSISMARLLACDAAIIPQVLGSDSVVLDQGRAVGLFSTAQRRAITTRDRGCAFPGCDIPPAWTDAHHIRWWIDGGFTDIDNGVLLCRRHHTVIHQGRWRICADPAGGRPWFVPPDHIDPARRRRRNSQFHLPEIASPRRRQ